MKKVLLTIIIATFLNISSPKPAKCLTVDFAVIAQNVLGMVQTITDTTQQVIMQANMIKQIESQGIGLASIKGILSDLLGKFDFKKIIAGSLLQPQVGKTKAKQLEVMNLEKEAYAEAAKANANKKLEIAEEDKAQTEARLNAKRVELTEKEGQLSSAKANRESLMGTGGSEEALAIDNLSKAQTEYDDTVRDIAELEELLVKKGQIADKVKEEADKAGTSQDPKFQSFENRVNETANGKDDAGIVVTTDLKEGLDWAQLDDLKAFDAGKYYDDYVTAHFYDKSKETSLSGLKGKALEAAQQKLQTAKDQITRNRKFTLINTASHLYQVSGSIRKERPMRESAAKHWFDKSKEEPDEINATAAYSNVRIENTRALLLYARLLAAKLQYKAAHAVYELDDKLEKLGEDKSSLDIDLGKYILTSEEIEKAKEMSKENKGVTNAPIK